MLIEIKLKINLDLKKESSLGKKLAIGAGVAAGTGYLANKAYYGVASYHHLNNLIKSIKNNIDDVASLKSAAHHLSKLPNFIGYKIYKVVEKKNKDDDDEPMPCSAYNDVIDTYRRIQQK